MKSMTLYEISDKYQFLLHEMYNHETGEVNENVLAKLNELADSAENKCINIVKIWEEFNKEIAAIKEAKERMAKREKAFKNQVDRLKEYLQTNMERCEIKKIECPEFVIGLQKNPPSVDVLNEDEVPHDYDKCPKRELDISKIKQDLQNGVVIPGVRLVQRNSVRIR